SDLLQLVDLQHPADLRQQAIQEAKVAAGDAEDRGQRFLVGESALRQLHSERLPSLAEQVADFRFRQGAEFMDEADAGVKVRVEYSYVLQQALEHRGDLVWRTPPRAADGSLSFPTFTLAGCPR